ncbi:Potassium voltage-gated channel subfamily A member 10 [Acropora cervicornis]|uniref:Potassium voltage-gated channel subfamily A member 10 n=2 Tax=Acropora TaxID=6127 RepID=A0AAD9QXT0_ACRCE|nr:Potassium voltage-gated channel subfamily A member 10 [Acropora cervicornis]
MEWRGNLGLSLHLHIVTVVYIGLLGVSLTTSQQTGREKLYGSVECPETMLIEWDNLLSRPPYAQKNSSFLSGTSGGLFQGFLEILLTECCQYSTDLIANSSAADEPDLKLPVVVNLEADCNSKKPSNLVPMVPGAGIAFVVVKGTQSLEMLKSLFTTWPVLLLTLILSFIAGIIAWLLENSKNEENFPRSFTKGTWEGFWWAFVSMTTVGYGDRFPLSVGGRLFAVVWILVGICVCSIFTAALTSSLTTLSMETKITLPGTKVVALLDSIESTIGFRNQAQVKRVSTADELHQELESGDVRGALMDAYFLVYYKQNYPTSKLKVQEVIQQDKLEYGARFKSMELAKCFQEKRYTMESDLYEIAESLFKQTLSRKFDNEQQDERHLFHHQGILFSPMFFGCLGLAAFLIFVGVAWDLLRRFRCRGHAKKDEFFMMPINGTTGTEAPSCHGKCCISEEQLKDLENKINEVSQSLKFIKGETL